jgi:outer membrane protein assembly factor BamB
MPILYASTSNACGGTAGVWALDLATPEKTVTVWKTNGGAVAGTAGPAIGSDGTLYAATADGDYTPAAFSNSVVALEAKTLKMLDLFTPGKSDFVSSPVVMNHNGKDLIAVVNKDGKMYLLDGASLGGADHKTPLSVSAKFANITTALPGALASWQDTDKTQWVLASVSGPPAAGSGFQAANGSVTSGAIVAFKVVDQGGKPALQPGWVSRDIASPLPPIVVNGVVFAAGAGPQGKAVLYALDGATGRELLNSGNAMTAAPKGALSEQFGTVYVQTADNILWSFGFPQDKEDFGSK